MRRLFGGLRVLLAGALATAVATTLLAPIASAERRVSGATAVDVRPAPGSVMATTTGVNLRKGPGTSYGVSTVLRAGTRVTMTGTIRGGFAAIRTGARKGWVSRRYLKAAGGLPGVVGTRYATADLLVRTRPGSSYRVVGEIGSGAAVSTTGVVVNGRAQIVYRSAARWVAAAYLSRGAPRFAVEKGLTPNAVKVHRAARATFPQITSYHGVRSGSSGDHPTGRALDIMIPNYKSSSGRALGARIASWARTNAKSLRIHYVIWNQRIWNVKRDKEGWRRMSDRGGDAANHKNHVHVSVY